MGISLGTGQGEEARWPLLCWAISVSYADDSMDHGAATCVGVGVGYRAHYCAVCEQPVAVVLQFAALGVGRAVLDRLYCYQKRCG